MVIEIGYRQLSAMVSYTAGISIGAAGTVLTAPSACTAALAGLGAGNLSLGVYRYKVTFYNGYGETEAGTVSNEIVVADPTSNGQVALTGIPLGAAGTYGRKIYRTEVNGSTFKLLATIANVADATYTDNIADGSLGADAPIFNTTADLPENEISTGSLNGWFEFSDDILLSEYGDVVPYEYTSGAVLRLVAPSGLYEPVEDIIDSEAALALFAPDGLEPLPEESLEETSEALLFWEAPSGLVIETPYVPYEYTSGAVLRLYSPAFDDELPEGGEVTEPIITSGATLIFKAPWGLVGTDIGDVDDIYGEITSAALLKWEGFIDSLQPAPTAAEVFTYTSEAVLNLIAPTGLVAIDDDIATLIHTSDATLKWEGQSVIFFAPTRAITSDGRLTFYAPPGLVEIAETSETWVLTGNGRHPSLYSNFNFNSYAVFNGKIYGAKDDGIYILEGTTDNGTAIRTGLRLITNFNIPRLKALRTIDPGNCGAKTTIRHKAYVRGDSMVYRLEDWGKFMASRHIRDDEMVLEFMDFDELSQVTIQVLDMVTI